MKTAKLGIRIGKDARIVGKVVELDVINNAFTLEVQGKKIVIETEAPELPEKGTWVEVIGSVINEEEVFARTINPIDPEVVEEYFQVIGEEPEDFHPFPELIEDEEKMEGGDAE